MERSEPTLVPEWLKNAGSSTVGGSILHADDHAASRVSRNKSFVNNNGRNFRRSSSSDRTSSSYFGRSSSSNSSGNFRCYSSFGRNHRDRDWEKDTYDYRDHDKSAKGDFRYCEFSDPFGNTSVGKFDRDGLRRSHSMISGKHGDTLPKRVVVDSNDATGKIANGVATRGNPVVGVDKAAFERDFPTLGTEERAVSPEVGRVPSPGLNASIQSLPGTLAIIGGEKWTSALAEVPILNGAQLSPVQQPASSSSVSGASSSTTSLNMAKTVAQGSIRAQASTQLSVGTQRLEELVIKQSRQLIPVTPSLPKTLALNSSDKQKSKVGPQLQHPLSSSLPVTHSPRGGHTVGKLYVLKPARDKNGTTPILKDSLSPTSGPNASTQAQLSDTVSDRKPILTVLEKRPTSQAQSRNDFFNLMRKKSMQSPSPVADPGVMADSLSPVLSSTFSDKNAGVAPVHEDASEAVEVFPLSLRSDVNCSVDGKKCVTDGKKYSSCEPIISEEEEAAFLRSLGWEENDEEGGCLTDEEISSFYRDLTKYINSKPSLKILQGAQLKFMLPLDSQVKGTDEIPNAKLES